MSSKPFTERFYSVARYAHASNRRSNPSDKPGYRRVVIEIRDPRLTTHDYNDYDYWDEAEPYSEPVSDFLARIVHTCELLEDPVIIWDGENSEVYFHIEALRPPTEAERAAEEKKRLAKEKKEKDQARKLLEKHPDLVKEFLAES